MASCLALPELASCAFIGLQAVLEALVLTVKGSGFHKRNTDYPTAVTA